MERSYLEILISQTWNGILPQYPISLRITGYIERRVIFITAKVKTKEDLGFYGDFPSSEPNAILKGR